ncbi:IS1479 transposase [Xanthomonas fragariae]|uniref:IS1479 transposase n=1 Tax=Xanthomonas fragariae TaxID=48664 RepID=A0A1Y6HB34_9XANT|nr:hypothetical protein BER92_02470 [Xanthomonas fragariae]ENZ96086.1 transposase [Xanthomonas fragariae LMG 25863]AOD17189.1 hypothetical protein BER93_02475 [Xanthomonas fragariae]SMQ96825.1 IS1479 transposase [Xanthomonas fragariae]SMR00719.1 hypothetical protein PD885_03498 [Xanthomonas fragariae]
MEATSRNDRTTLSDVGPAWSAAERIGEDIADSSVAAVWYALSDQAMEEALHEIPTLRRFAQLGGVDNVPDATKILNGHRLPPVPAC